MEMNNENWKVENGNLGMGNGKWKMESGTFNIKHLTFNTQQFINSTILPKGCLWQSISLYSSAKNGYL
jgi:hypothetical protein